jgi:hypothetical protein
MKTETITFYIIYMRFAWLLFLLPGIGSCTENVPLRQDSLIEAEIRDWGSPSVDGCGWVIWVSNDSYYRPINLAKDFEIHGLKILIDFEETGDEGLCGFPHPTPKYVPKIRIHRIKQI